MNAEEEEAPGRKGLDRPREGKKRAEAQFPTVAALCPGRSLPEMTMVVFSCRQKTTNPG